MEAFDPRLGPQPVFGVSRPAFSATRTEQLLAILSYPAAYLYVCVLFSAGQNMRVLFSAFTLLFCLGVEYAHRDVSAGWERWVWLASLALCTLCPLWGAGRVWAGYSGLFVHGFAIYYTLCRADRLLEGRTGHLLPVDAFYGAIIFPFSHFFLRVRVLGTLPRRRAKADGMTVLWSAFATVAAVGAFIAAGRLLSRADSGFAQLIQPLFRLADFSPFLLRLALSLPVGAYVYGLVAGVGRESAQRKESICGALERLRAVPVGAWIALLAAFALLYGVFFFVQGRYAFGAFTRTLPADFTVAEYARQGFFELCRVMLLNFALLWLALRSARVPARTHRGLRIAATVVLTESLLLAVTAGSKLWLYIDCFGFTPLRLQSAWLIAVLAAGVMACLWSLWTARRSARAWAIFSGLSLALLHLV